MNDRQMADALGRALLAQRRQLDGVRSSMGVLLDGFESQIDAALELVAALQERARERQAAAQVSTEGPATPAGPKVFGGHRSAPAALGDAPVLPAVPDDFNARPAATGGTSTTIPREP